VLAALVGMLALGTWWWSLKSTSDPVAADPVSAYATVLTSDPCTAADATTSVSFTTANGPATAAIHVCGYKPNQSLLVEYLRADPAQARPAGSTPAPTSAVKRLLPVGILFLTVVVAAALVFLVRDRPRRRHPRPEPVTTRSARHGLDSEGTANRDEPAAVAGSFVPDEHAGSSQ
jgi:hypothetical protein